MTNINCKAIEEVTLEKEKNGLDYLSDIYYGKIENERDVSPVLRLFSKDGLKFENSYINSVKLILLYGGNLTYTNTHNHSPSLVKNFPIVEPMIRVNFNENKTEFMFDYNLTRNFEGYDNEFSHKISRLAITHKLNENQKIVIGQGDRVPAIMNGSLPTFMQEMVSKSQIGRTMGDSSSMGLRNVADYKYLEYDIGLYDSTRFMKDFGNGLDFNGRIIFKPLANIEEDKAGIWKIGTGYNIGDYYNSYHLYSVFTNYDYKKFHFRAEYADADGYNAVKYSKNDADGFYTTLAYDITPKLQLIGRYDYFVPNKLHNNSNSQEYTAGITYRPFKNIKFLLNYVKREESNGSDSNMILFATRFII